MAETVPLPAVKPGMTLAEAVSNRWGKILLNKGSQLTSRHISILENWEISSVVVENGPEAEAIPPVDPPTLERIRKRVEERFLWEPKSPLEKELFALAFEQAVLRFQRKLLLQKGNKEGHPAKPQGNEPNRSEMRRTA